MRRLAHSKRLGLLSCVPALLLVQEVKAQQITREGDRWVQTITGTALPAARLRVNAQGPVHLEAGAANDISYTARFSVPINQVRNEDDARRLFSRLRAFSARGMAVVTAPGGPVTTNLSIRTPRLSGVTIHNADGAVEANGIDGALEIFSGAGELKCDRIRGDCRLTTGGGNIQVGEVMGELHGITAGGRILVKDVRGNAILQSAGGYIEVDNAGGSVDVTTAGGAIRVNNAAGAVTAATGGGSIVVGKAGGIVTVRNTAGPVQIGAAAGVRCETRFGAVRLSNIAGPMQVSAAVGNIMANLINGRPFGDSILETANGDITVLVPSNLGVTILARGMPRRIVSDFPSVSIERRGPEMVAEGAINGGGPMLRLTGMGGTILIKRQ